MPKHILVKPQYRKLIMHWKIIFVIFLVISACRDLVKESDTGACNSAIDARNYDEALSVCTSRKDKASAYMGKAGYDIINLLKSSGTSTSTLTDPTTGSTLGKDDNNGASILNILQLSVANIANKNTRAAAISSSRTNLDNASAQLQPYLGDADEPLLADEILLNTFAISFAMQLNQLEIYDNATTSKYIWPEGDNVTDLDCEEVDNVGTAGAAAVLIPMDGHIWAAERNGMSCARMKNAIVGLDSGNYTDAYDNLTAWKDNDSRGLLPEIFREEVCTPVETLTTYMTSLAANIIELKKTISLDGDNTKAITKADNSTNELLKAVGCKE